MEKTKREKVQFIIIIILCFAILFGIAFFASELKTCEVKDEVKEGELEVIGISEFRKIYKEKETSIIYIARPTCAYCRKQEPIVKEIIGEYPDLRLYYLNTDELTEEELIEVLKIDTELFGESGENFGTPTTLAVSNGKVVDSLIGYTQKTEYLEFLKTNDLI